MSENILILNLNTGHDIATSAYLIGAIKTEKPQASVEILVDKKHEGVARILSGVSAVHTIDTEMIQTIYDNPLYSNAFAVNEFTSSIKDISEKEWSHIVNYSNDDISSYLISSINAENKVGTSITVNGAAKCSDVWSIYQNHVASKQTRLPIDKVTIRNHMMNLPVQNDYLKVKHDENYSVVAGQNFRRIREMKGSAGTFVVGISLEQSQNGHSFDMETYTEIIEALEESDDYKAVLLLNGKNYQRSIANELNKNFNNSLISINIDIAALTSVVSNLDAIVSTSNETLAIADLMETKCIEVKDANATHQAPYAMNQGSYTIFQKDTRPLASDVLLALNEEFGTELPISCMQSDNQVYKSINDEYGQLYTQIRGSLDVQAELRYHLGRSYFFETLGYPRNNELLKHIHENTDKEQLMHFVSSLRSELTSTVKLLLATLRSLKGVKNSEGNLNTFIGYLDNLISVGKQDSLTGDIIRNFEGKIENIETNDIDTNIKSIEDYLFALKTDLQILTGYLGDLVQPSTTEDTTSVQGQQETQS